ncbi:MAG: hypothetical protein ABSG32_18355 [Terriglobia bacterium]|jgi:hypothetical protein
MSAQNLDQLCARYGYEIASSTRDENHITRSLGVLQEDGVYAFFLYQESKRGKSTGAKGSKRADGKKEDVKSVAAQGSGKTNDSATALSSLCAQMLRDPTVSILPTGDDTFEAVRKLADDLNGLLLAKRLLEQTLIYARYHAKALEPAK